MTTSVALLGAALTLLQGSVAASKLQVRPASRPPAAWQAPVAPLSELQLRSSGGLIPDDANTVCHAWFDGTAIQDTKGCAWTMNGTVPQNVASPFYPSGFSGAQQKGAGSFSDANRYDLGTGSDVLDFTGDFSACFIVTPVTLAVDSVAFSNGVTNTSGWYFNARSNHATLGPAIVFQSGATTTQVSLPQAQQMPAGAASVTCVGRAGSTGYIKQNLGALVTGPAGTITPGTGGAAFLGRHFTAGFPFGGIIFEAWFSTTTPSDDLFTAIQRRVFGMLGTKSEPITVTRTSTGTYTTPDGLIWTAPANVARVGCEDTAATKCGILVEPDRANLALQSEVLNNVAWTATNVTITADQCVLPIGPAGTTTLESLVSTVNTGTVAQAVTVTSSVGPHTVSGYFRATTGTQTGTIGMTFGTGNATSCTCIRSDGGTCTTGTSTATGFAYGSFTTAAAVRMMLTCSTTLAATAVTAFATGGQYLTSTGTVCGGAMQFEQGSPYATSYIATAGTAVARTADAVSAVNPLASINPGSWCTEATATPENTRAWSPGVDNFPFVAGYGANGATNTSRYFTASGSNSFFVHDASGTSKSIVVADGFAAGSTHKIAFGASAGSLKLLHDGVSVGSETGVGTGLITTWPASVTVGAPSDGTHFFGGWIRDFKVWRTDCR